MQQRSCSEIGSALLSIFVAASVGCGQKNDNAAAQGRDDAGVDGAGVPTPDDIPILVADGGGQEAGRVNSFAILPKDPVLDVIVTGGVVTSAVLEGGGNANPLAFQVQGDTGAGVVWSVDRGGAGTIDKITGSFAATGTVAGVAIVTASSGARIATTTVTVRVKATSNGKPSGTDPGNDGDLGGVGGVGGAPLGGPVDAPTLGRLLAPGQPITSSNELNWLYPYDKTVWPRGILAPLLQWQTSHPASAVSIHLKEKNFEFTGTYAGTNLVNQPVEALAWRQATLSNTGDLLHVDLKIDSGGVTYGPVSQDWIISPGLLQGTVYYDSYNSQVTGSLQGKGAKGVVLAIKPGATSPTVAVSSTQGACHVCHSEPADGSMIVMQGPDFDSTEVYSLKNPGDKIATFPAGGSEQNKLDWAAIYPDGSMGLANSRDGFHAYNQDSNLFRITDGSAIASTGFRDVVTQAVTPAFSPDGRKLVFGFWNGPGTSALTPSQGHTLGLLDFDCGAPLGKVTCSGQAYAFSGARTLYRDDKRTLGFPSFLPDGNGVVFQSTIHGSSDGSVLYTWKGGTAELWFANVPDASGQPAAQGEPMYALDGYDASGQSYLPINSDHPIDPERNLPADTSLNYQPAVNPVPSGGYYWVVFTSRRLYGNVLTGEPWADEWSGDPALFTKKLWVAAIDMKPTPGKDPSHPAFYLPGQELRAGNMRGFWVSEPCKSDGLSCTSASECCNGFCNGGDQQGSEPTCGSRPVKSCSEEFELCTKDADCCDAATGTLCINSRCARPQPPVN